MASTPDKTSTSPSASIETALDMNSHPFPDGEDRANLCHFEHAQPVDEAPLNGGVAVNMANSGDPASLLQHHLLNSHRNNHNHGREQPLPPPPPPPPYSEIPGTVPLHSGRNSGPPPSYDDVINPDAPPPSYQSLFGQVREARKASSGLLDFLRKLVLILLGTLGVTILLGFTVLIPFTMVVIGAMHMDQCPAENIPTFLLVGGLVWVLKNLLNFWSTCRRTNGADPEGEAEIQARHRRHESLLNCFLFGWFIAGCVLVYRVYPPNYEDPTARDYCNRTVYLYAFWLVTSTFIIFGLFMGCLCCLTISSVITSNENNESDNN